LTQKTDRKELRKPDEFQVVAGHAMDWVAAHQRTIAIGIAAVAAVVLLAWGASSYRSSREDKAGAQLSEALDLASRPIAGEGPANPGTETFASKDEREKAVLAALEKVRTEHGGTLAAQTAQAELGFQKVKAGDDAGGQKDLQEFIDKSDAKHPLRAFALESLGYAYEGQKQLDAARAAFAKLAEAGAPDRAAFQSARLSLEEGKPDAKQQLEQVAKDYPKDPVAAAANERLELASLPKAEPGQPTASATPVADPLPAKGAKKPAPKVAARPAQKPAPKKK
jgi:tetratricopeptide (TPR) repeat protein